MMQTEQFFEELSIPRRDMFVFSETRYRVYCDAKKYKIVEAASALDALKNSGISKAYKIERHNPMDDNVIQFVPASLENLALKEPEPIEEKEYVEVSSETEQGASVNFANAEKTEINTPLTNTNQLPKIDESPVLSNEEVDKLLNGQ